MVALPPSPSGQFIAQRCFDLYDRRDGQDLASQGAVGRYVRLTTQREQGRMLVEQVEDGYQGWLAEGDLAALTPAREPYQWQAVSEEEIQRRLPGVIDYILEAQKTPNHYLWGGNVGPNYDCSGLIQAAFQSQGIWLPRDSYQQAAFCQEICDLRLEQQAGSLDANRVAASVEKLRPGDLIFFGSKRVDHVGLYLGGGQYVHSSGKTMGRNGIGIDSLTDLRDPISAKYFPKWWQCGRVVKSFNPHQDSLGVINIEVDVDLLK